MSLYYEDGDVKLYHGRCEDILPTLSLEGSVHLLTDPPYFKVNDSDWDNQWGKAAEFLDWMGEWLDLAKPLLSADASVWVFASPQLESSVGAVVAERFRVLNSVRWIKETGYHMKTSLLEMRAFRPAWEGIIFAEQGGESFRSQELESSKLGYSQIGSSLREARKGAGLSRDDVARTIVPRYQNLASAKARVGSWEIGNERLTAASFSDLASLTGGLSWGSFEALSAAYDDADHSRRIKRKELRDAFENVRRPFHVTSRDRSTDLFQFPGTPAKEGRHPCEKPEGLLTHMIETTTRPGDTILDPFSGSGAVLDVARKLGRKAVGIEMDAHWCKQAAQRLAAQPFDFGEWTA